MEKVMCCKLLCEDCVSNLKLTDPQHEAKI
jgi:hypothetical protein